MGPYTTSRCGTPIYMSPEALRSHERYGKPSDIWSLGAVISFICNTIHLFENIEDVFTWPGGRSSLDRNKYDIVLRQLVANMLCPNAAARPTASQILEKTSRNTMRHNVSRTLMESGHRSRLVPSYPLHPETLLPSLGRLDHTPPVQRWTHRSGPIFYDDDDDDYDDDDESDSEEYPTCVSGAAICHGL